MLGYQILGLRARFYFGSPQELILVSAHIKYFIWLNVDR